MWIFALKPSCVIIISVHLVMVVAGSLTQLSLWHALEMGIGVSRQGCRSGAEISSNEFADTQQKERGCSRIYPIEVSLL